MQLSKIKDSLGEQVSNRQEFIDDIYEECQNLIQNHWEEIALNKEVIKLNPDWEAYRELEGKGCFKIFTARNQEGKLVGYFAVIVSRSLHYKDHLFANNDVLYLDPAYRKGMCGLRLIKFAEKCLKEDGVTLLIINSKVHQSFSPLMERMGYRTAETVHTKIIG